MKVCLVGAGAIGGFIGAKLAAAGQAQLTVLARGATLASLQQHGWRLNTNGKLLQVPARTVQSAAELEVQDLVVIAVKGPAMAQVASNIAPLLGPSTVVLPAVNGVPWWFGQELPGLSGARLRSVDPTGEISAHIPLRQVLGCVVYLSASMPEPGLVQHVSGNGLTLGEPHGSISDRARQISALLAHAGIDATLSENIRTDVWYKLWGNLTINPVSAITGATAERILADPLVRSFCTAAMDEASAIGARIGCAIDQSAEDRHALTAALGAFKTSMLQDVENGRAIELDAIVGATYEIGQRLGLPTPNIAALFGITRLFAQTRGLYPLP